MKTKLLLLISLFLSISTFAQNYPVGHLSSTFTDASRNNRSIPVEIYYPATTAGNNVPVATDAQFATIAFGHGFVMGWDAYENIWQTLVPNGFVMVFPKTEGGIAPSHAEFGKDLAFCIARMQSLNQDASSIFFNRLSSTSALMGHSMGGGAAFIGMQQNTSITALAVLAPAETNPSAITAAATLNVPALVIAGSNDCVTPPSTNQLPMYTSLASGCKTYVNITGASHCQMSDFNLLCQIGEATCSPGPDISRDEQHQVIADYIVPWLRANLNNDCQSGSAFNDLIESDDAVSFLRTCEQCEELSVAAIGERKIKLSPNPVSDMLTVEMQGSGNLELFDLFGRKLLSVRIETSQRLNLDFLPQGVYVYRVTSTSGNQSGKIVKK
ncbi:T9SS type A sorting domain-containing protein [Flavobacterium sp.]|uniref:poly(ethylene terephthalate) hydrolase family protein n=1 Tax=Flavobacterium sp. TaxID=239 RepID=UPI0025BA3FAE|nr:T9SS type A sorting domain-containing protein [Flavobacterium sp.]